MNLHNHDNYSSDARFLSLKHWLNHDCNLTIESIIPIAGGASFRRYFRVHSKNCSYVVMDAPPAQENCHNFITIDRLFESAGLHVPHIFETDLNQGFLLLSDLGDRLYIKELNSKSVNKKYETAMDALLNIAQTNQGSLKRFDSNFMYNELNAFLNWMIGTHLQIDLSDSVEQTLRHSFDVLIESASNQPQVVIHRDYHSFNLLSLANDQVGIIDFQDAMVGPVTYDLVSLLRDCYIDWPKKDVENWAWSYAEKAIDANIFKPVDRSTFLKWFDLMGMQRHLKASYIFARKYHRDNDDTFLQYLPRTFQYILSITKQYQEFESIYKLMNNTILPRLFSKEETTAT